jgi:serine/threonine protein kinase
VYLVQIFDEICTQILDEFAYMTANTFTIEQIKKMAGDVIITVGPEALGQRAMTDFIRDECSARRDVINDRVAVFARFLANEASSHYEYRAFGVEALAKASVEVSIRHGMADFQMQNLVDESPEAAFICKCWSDSLTRTFANDIRDLYENEHLFKVSKDKFPNIVLRAGSELESCSDDQEKSDLSESFAKGCSLDSGCTTPKKDKVLKGIFIPDFANKYIAKEQLGSGGFGAVYLGRLKRTEKSKPKSVAVKVFNPDINELEFKPDYLRELYALSVLRHPNIVKLKGACFEDGKKKAYLATELLGCQLKDVSSRYVGHVYQNSILMKKQSESQPVETPARKELFPTTSESLQETSPAVPASTESTKPNNRLSLQQRFSYAKQLLGGVAYMHSMGIIHRDLCPRNVMLTKNRTTIKIIDFGISRQIHTNVCESVHTSIAAKIHFRSPEVWLKSGKYDTKIDVWSCACIIYELFTGEPCFVGPDSDSVFDCIITKVGLPPPTSAVWKWDDVDDLDKLKKKPLSGSGFSEVGHPQVEDILKKMFAIDPNERLSAVEALALFEEIKL